VNLSCHLGFGTAWVAIVVNLTILGSEKKGMAAAFSFRLRSRLDFYLSFGSLAGLELRAVGDRAT